MLLEEAWSRHLAPRHPDAPTMISLFAGGGGSSLGYSMAGFRELLVVEWDENAVETLRLNFPAVPIYHGDIVKLSVEECLRLAGIEPGELDVLDGSPPCQGFSTAGKRQLDDERNSLFREYVRLLRGLQPRAFVMENVSGLVKGKMRLAFAEILRELKTSGYRVKVRLLNAMFFNVPQSRQRLIFVGTRENLGIEPSHPKGQSEAVTLASALANIRTKTMSGDNPRNSKKAFGATRRNDWNGVGPTLSTRPHRHGLHPSEYRFFSLEEHKRIASFPDEFRVALPLSDQFKRIGNSVPPLFMRAIAKHVADLIRSCDTKPEPDVSGARTG
jgi:DNA (cytosine-5)-methyltransferase 1